MRLLESIQIFDGKAQRLPYHEERMNRSRHELFCCANDIYLEEFMQIPEDFKWGKVKCRISYHHEIVNISWFEYEARQIDYFHLVDSQIDYFYKYADRSGFEELLKSLPGEAEIIIVKNGEITDTSYSNLVFKGLDNQWYTPLNPLLKGTQREFLLDEGIIEERIIKPEDLSQFSHFMMINALLDFDESKAFDIHKIKLVL